MKISLIFVQSLYKLYFYENRTSTTSVSHRHGIQHHGHKPGNTTCLGTTLPTDKSDPDGIGASSLQRA